MYAILPAAGHGERMQQTLPKQYLSVDGHTLISRSLQPLLSHEAIKKVVVALAAHDTWASQESWFTHPKICSAVGGATRAESVYQGLSALAGIAQAEDWILVHDAVRPLLTQNLLDQLFEKCKNDPTGGLLAIPVRDTLKQVNAEQRVEATVDRQRLWLAQTPQLFRYHHLHRALSLHRQTVAITDEASAIEALGLTPLLVPGSVLNLKITYPEDVVLLSAILQYEKEKK